MQYEQTKARLAETISQWNGHTIESTGSEVVDHAGTLYNVDGSTEDPKIDGQSWKALLEANGIGGNCYVTAPVQPGNTHPAFNVGGHMTPHANGQVADGGTCYLMPLCSWHNNKARDGIAFTHTETKMLKLTGYNDDELAVTFIARLRSDEPYSIIYRQRDEWLTRNLSETEADEVKSGRRPEGPDDADLSEYVLLKRYNDDGKQYLSVDSVK